MRITVAVCTWNRANLLDQTLESMTRLRTHDLVWELLVVNNNCTDETDSVIERRSAQLPIRRLSEPRQGLAHARNRAVEHANGDMILWTDDDVLVDPDWLAEYARGTHAYPDSAFFGGPIRPRFEGTPPEWLNAVWKRVRNAYAIRELGDEPFEFDQRVVPFGANFAVRMAVQRRYPFNPETGRRAGIMLGGDETTVLRSMLQDGLTGTWLPRAALLHFIPGNRQTEAYLRQYFYGQGIARAMRRSNNGSRAGLLRRALHAELKYRIKRPFYRPESWIGDLIRASVTRAELAYRPVGSEVKTTARGAHQ